MTLFQDFPAWIEFMLKDEILYKGLAVGNLLLQLLPIPALIFIRKPLLRALVGLCFILETLGLYYIMGLDDLEWIALYVFFVDWRLLFARFTTLPVSDYIVSATKKKWKLRFSVTFFSFYLISGYNFIHPKFCCTFNTYPFSAFPMYSTNSAKAPYYKHFAYSHDGLMFEFAGYKATNPIPKEKMERTLAYYNYPTNK